MSLIHTKNSEADWKFYERLGLISAIGWFIIVFLGIIAIILSTPIIGAIIILSIIAIVPPIIFYKTSRKEYLIKNM